MRWIRAAVPTLVVLVAILATLNIATLLSESVHRVAYNAVAAVARAVCGAPCLASSPTEVHKRAVEAATAEVARSYAQLEAKHRALDASTIALVAATNMLVDKHRIVKTSAWSVSRRMASRVARGASRKAASVVGQAIPFVGTALVWGLAVIDIGDACDAMKDLAELDASLGHETSADAVAVCGVSVPTMAEISKQLTTGWRAAYESAARAINSDGRATVPSEATKPGDATAKGWYCRIFGC